MAQAIKAACGIILARSDGTTVVIDHDEVAAIRMALGAPPTGREVHETALAHAQGHLAYHQSLSAAGLEAVGLDDFARGTKG